MNNRDPFGHLPGIDALNTSPIQNRQIGISVTTFISVINWKMETGDGNGEKTNDKDRLHFLLFKTMLEEHDYLQKKQLKQIKEEVLQRKNSYLGLCPHHVLD